MTAREILDQGFAKSFLSRLFGEEMPEDYKKLEAKYIDALTQSCNGTITSPNSIPKKRFRSCESLFCLARAIVLTLCLFRF